MQGEQSTRACTGDLPNQMLDTGPQVVVRMFVCTDQSNEILGQPFDVTNPDSKHGLGSRFGIRVMVEG